MILPDSQKGITKTALDLIDICRSSQGTRTASYRSYGQWIETGRAAGGLGLANMLHAHIERLQAHLFSPTGLRFTIDFENKYPKEMLQKGQVAAKALSRVWELSGVDLTYAAAVGESLKYGAALLKQGGYVSDSGTEISPRIVMPWQFGVYNENDNSLDRQEAMCETVFLTEPEVWRRVRHLPDAEKLYKRVIANATKNDGTGVPQSFMHQVLSTAVLDVNLQNSTQPPPGGIVQLSNDPNTGGMGPDSAATVVPMHELWVQDDERDDRVTIQLIEPDILIAPLMKRSNLFCPGSQPYTLIQPNRTPGYFWGRSEIVDLQMLQNALTEGLDNIKRLMGTQFDKVLAFSGYDGLTDETYDQFRSAGFLGMPQGAQVNDLTPQLPQNAFQYIETVLKLMDMVSGFHNILSGQGEPGVRSGMQADMMLRTASPRLRDRSLIVERQCAVAGEATFSFMQAKDARAYWVNLTEDGEQEFLLSQLPEDRRVSVDSHSSSPIYHDDHMNVIGFLAKSGVIDGETLIDLIPDLPQKDLLKENLRERQARQAQFIKQNPQVLEEGGKKERQAALKAATG